MSWLVNSIANSLNLDEEEGDDEEEDENRASAGVKEDLSELSQTLTRQLWGVASFLTPPPPESFDEQNGSKSAGIDGIRSDLWEIKGKFRSGISKLSSNKAVSEFGKIASNIMQFVEEEGETVEDYLQRGVVGVTEEVVAFVRDVALHPQNWLNFPLPDNNDEEEDFEMSDIQQEHAFVIERLAPRLAALRTELCPSYMNDSHFWKVYFVLVHSRLTSQAAELLSTSQILKARAMLTQKSQTSNSIPDDSGRASESPSATNEERLTVKLNDNPESLPANISVISQYNSTETPTIPDELCSSGVIDIPIEEDDDISFSDLEDEDVDIPIR